MVLMDQTACAVGGLIHIDFKDPKAPVVEKVDVDFENHACSLCIVDTKGSHQDLTPDYAQIPADMKAIATYFGKEVLRDVDEKEFFAAIPALRESLETVRCFGLCISSVIMRELQHRLHPFAKEDLKISLI